MKLSEYKQLKAKKPSKYKSEKSGGYDSRKEHLRALHLEFQEGLGIISDLKKQVKFALIPAQYVMGFKGKMICARRECSYIADFVYTEDDKQIVEDPKGFRTKGYLHKKRLMKLIYGIEIKET